MIMRLCIPKITGHPGCDRLPVVYKMTAALIDGLSSARQLVISRSTERHVVF